MYHETSISTIYKPVFISKNHHSDKEKIQLFLNDNQDKIILDLFASQKKELIRVRHPRRRLSQDEIDSLYIEWLGDREESSQGTWVYYPWSNRLLHILDQNEFIELRTTRNHYKITPKEQSELIHKSIGVIGLSVGHAVAVSIATERICGKLKLADFDTIELSNLNRIRTGLHNIGVNKAIVTAREIAEIDPFLNVECYTNGLNTGNMPEFLTGGGKLDVLIDECDDIALKISCRRMAAAEHIPVVMETSDRGMLDVERFDTEPSRPVFHGFLEGIPTDKLENISEEEKLPLVLKIVNAINGSRRGKMSLVEIGQTISTWPQLASSVTLGGGVVTDVCRRILLKQFHDSGRYYVDLEELIGDKKTDKTSHDRPNPYPLFDFEEAKKTASSFHFPGGSEVPPETLEEIVKAACQAPSTGNDQPWKWLYVNAALYLFHDPHRSFSFGDFDQIASNISFGAAFENLILKSYEAGFSVGSRIFPLGEKSALIAVMHFIPRSSDDQIFEPGSVRYIYDRCTNRNPSQPVPVPDEDVAVLRNAAESIEGARFHFFDKKNHLSALGEIIGECDRVRLLNPNGHYDFVKREMKWTPRDADASRDGIDIRTLGLSAGQAAALSIIRDEGITQLLKQIEGGGALIDAAKMTVRGASGLGMITLPAYTYQNFFLGGMAMQRLWLKAEQLGYAIHPLISPFYLFPRITKGNGEGLDQSEVQRLNEVRKRFLELTAFEDHRAEVFLFKIAKARKPDIYSFRLPLQETFLTETSEKW